MTNANRHTMERIFLLTNDDGIHVYFIRAIAEKLQNFGKVYIAAPLREQSWIGRAVSRHRDVEVTRYHGYKGIEAWQVSGTPSDAVNIAIGHLMPAPPDVVVSGINIGYNAFSPVLLSSGTVAGALEGAAWGIPAVALSFHLKGEDFYAVKQSPENPSPAVKPRIDLAAELGAQFAAKKAGQKNSKGLVDNINFPANLQPGAPWVATRPSKIRMGSMFSNLDNHVFRFQYMSREPRSESNSLPGDYETFCRGKISHSILNFMDI